MAWRFDGRFGRIRLNRWNRQIGQHGLKLRNRNLFCDHHRNLRFHSTHCDHQCDCYVIELDSAPRTTAGCRHVFHFPSFSRLSRTRKPVILRIRGNGSGFSSGNWIDPAAVARCDRSSANAFTADAVG